MILIGIECEAVGITAQVQGIHGVYLEWEVYIVSEIDAWSFTLMSLLNYVQHTMSA